MKLQLEENYQSSSTE